MPRRTARVNVGSTNRGSPSVGERTARFRERENLAQIGDTCANLAGTMSVAYNGHDPMRDIFRKLDTDFDGKVSLRNVRGATLKIDPKNPPARQEDLGVTFDVTVAT